mmetsp:Transcript_22408/g.47327  ORF Transcript_22408/g.47327 Transcript_22408/m.47327 type:complete len:336 (+) Transcript_22408:1893-2900(+)
MTKVTLWFSNVYTRLPSSVFRVGSSDGSHLWVVDREMITRFSLWYNRHHRLPFIIDENNYYIILVYTLRDHGLPSHVCRRTCIFIFTSVPSTSYNFFKTTEFRSVPQKEYIHKNCSLVSTLHCHPILLSFGQEPRAFVHGHQFGVFIDPTVGIGLAIAVLGIRAGDFDLQRLLVSGTNGGDEKRNNGVENHPNDVHAFPKDHAVKEFYLVPVGTDTVRDDVDSPGNLHNANRGQTGEVCLANHLRSLCRKVRRVRLSRYDDVKRILEGDQKKRNLEAEESQCVASGIVVRDAYKNHACFLFCFVSGLFFTKEYGMVSDRGARCGRIHCSVCPARQ